MLDLVNKSQAGLTKMIKIKRKTHFFLTKLEQLQKYTFYICLFELIPNCLFRIMYLNFIIELNWFYSDESYVRNFCVFVYEIKTLSIVQTVFPLGKT